MDVTRRIARSRLVSAAVAAFLCGSAGCAQWMSDFSPGDIWDNMTPSKETWQKMSPSNIWHSLSPNELHKLNYGPGMSSDAYYSVRDDWMRDAGGRNTASTPVERADKRESFDGEATIRE